MVLFLIMPSAAFAQSGGGHDPICCNMMAVGENEAAVSDLLPVISISDQTLNALGLTRIQFLNQLAASLFVNSDSTASLQIPVATENTDSYNLTAEDFYAIPLESVDALMVDSSQYVILTDGVTYVVIFFVS
jgi:hypothetical protein